jgi:hypothetical protein
MNNIIKRIWYYAKNYGLSETLKYFLGRFRFIRLLKLSLNQLTHSNQTYNLSKTLFDKVHTQVIIDQLKCTGYYPNINLPKEYITPILEHAHEGKVVSTYKNARHSYEYKNRLNYEQSNKCKFITAHYTNESMLNPIFKQISEDPMVLSVATQFLGKRPSKIDTRLWWSFATNASNEERLNNFQTVLFHYDVAGYIFLYLNFYLTNVDSYSGPHVLVSGSHKRKRLAFLFSSANQSDQAINDFYNKEDFIQMDGPAGTGFFEDSSCFHKAVAPKEKDRLLLQIRFGA